jgi:flagellar assembly factor FliW
MQTIDFISDLPGFPGRRHFTLARLDPEGVAYEIKDVDDHSIRLVAVPSVAFFPDYSPEIDSDMATALGIGGQSPDEDALVLLVVTLGDTLQTTTANQLAPIIVGVRSGRAVQAVMDDVSRFPLRVPLATG